MWKEHTGIACVERELAYRRSSEAQSTEQPEGVVGHVGREGKQPQLLQGLKAMQKSGTSFEQWETMEVRQRGTI